MTPPIRFLIAVTGGWACGRGAILLWSGGADGLHLPHPGGSALASAGAGGLAQPAGWPTYLPPQRPPRVRPAPAAASAGTAPAAGPGRRAAKTRAVAAAGAAAHSRRAAWRGRTVAGSAVGSAADSAAENLLAAAQPAGAAPLPGPARGRSGWPGRLSLAGFVHVRRGSGPDLAAAGSLGGSQTGARLAYRLKGSASAPLSLVGRLSAPLAQRGAHAALGIEWQPLGRVPLRIVAEKRQALGRGGRSAFSLGVHGGVSNVEAGAGFRLEAYGQAGMVGLRARDIFADGQLRALRPVARQGSLKVGAGVWAAAQPGVARLDIGPSASLRIAGTDTTLILDWRHRAAGNARPGSGPALTVWTDF